MEKKFIVRDLLAFDRTKMANERTFLAYIRTFVVMIASGAALLKLFDVVWAHTAGIVLVITGVIVLVIGIMQYVHMSRHLKDYTPDD